MALVPEWTDKVLLFEVTLEPPTDTYEASESGNIGRTVIDGMIVVYDLDDPPNWLYAVLEMCDEDGNTDQAVSWGPY